MITRKNDDGSITFIYESWEEILNTQSTYEPDPDLYLKDRADERLWGY